MKLKMMEKNDFIEVLRRYQDERILLKITTRKDRFFFGYIIEIKERELILKNDRTERYAIILFEDILKLEVKND